MADVAPDIPANPTRPNMQWPHPWETKEEICARSQPRRGGATEDDSDSEEDDEEGGAAPQRRKLPVLDVEPYTGSLKGAVQMCLEKAPDQSLTLQEIYDFFEINSGVFSAVTSLSLDWRASVRCALFYNVQTFTKVHQTSRWTLRTKADGPAKRLNCKAGSRADVLVRVGGRITSALLGSLTISVGHFVEVAPNSVDDLPVVGLVQEFFVDQDGDKVAKIQIFLRVADMVALGAPISSRGLASCVDLYETDAEELVCLSDVVRPCIIRSAATAELLMREGEMWPPGSPPGWSPTVYTCDRQLATEKAARDNWKYWVAPTPRHRPDDVRRASKKLLNMEEREGRLLMVSWSGEGEDMSAKFSMPPRSQNQKAAAAVLAAKKRAASSRGMGDDEEEDGDDDDERTKILPVPERKCDFTADRASIVDEALEVVTKELPEMGFKKSVLLAKRNTSMCMLRDGAVIGCVVYSHVQPQNFLHLLITCVDSCFQLRGYGDRIAQWVTSQCMALGAERIIVSADETAVPFFTRMGFSRNIGAVAKRTLKQVEFRRCLKSHVMVFEANPDHADGPPSTPTSSGASSAVASAAGTPTAAGRGKGKSPKNEKVTTSPPGTSAGKRKVRADQEICTPSERVVRAATGKLRAAELRAADKAATREAEAAASQRPSRVAKSLARDNVFASSLAAKPYIV